MADENDAGDEQVVRNLNTLVEVDGDLIPVQRLIDAIHQAGGLHDEVKNLREFRDSATQFLRREGEQHEIATAASKMLEGAGFNDDEIKEYVGDWNRSQSQTDDEPEEEAEENTQGNKAQNMENDPRYDKLASETRQMRLRLMQQEMQKGVTEAIDSNSDIGKMLTGLDKTRGREHATGAYQAIQDQIRKATMDRLYERRDKTGGSFSEDWIQEEAARAAADVAKSYSTVIGDFDQIGRTPETVTEMDTLAAKPPVAVPEFKKGMDRGDIDTNVRAWNTDSLSRLAMETSAGGESKA